MPSRKYIYMVNRFVLGSRTEAMIRALESASGKCSRTFEVCVSDTPQEARDKALRYRERDCVVTAVGGDGSINLLLNDLAGGESTLAFVPFGTGNDLYRACLETMKDGTHQVDLIRVNDRLCINAICFGIDADIANDERFIHNRLIPQTLRYHAGVVSHFLLWRGGRHLEVECDGQTIRKEFTTIVAANARYYGGGYKICPDSLMDDGYMDLCLVDRLGKVNMARTILSMKNAGHLKNPALRMLRTKRAVITAGEPLKVNVDGEAMTAERFELEVIPKGCRLDFDRKFIREVTQTRQETGA